MKIWFPCIRFGTGTDQYTKLLANELIKNGHTATISWLPHYYEFLPCFFTRLIIPDDIDIIHTNSCQGLSIASPPLVTTLHSCVHDPLFLPHKSRAQAYYHRFYIKPREYKSINSARATIAVSEYTAMIAKEQFPGCNPHVILNGVDTDFFVPYPALPADKKIFRLLFAGKLSCRKGVDLLPGIMNALGKNYLLYCTGNRPKSMNKCENIIFIGTLSQKKLLEQYQLCDALLFPTRCESFGYVAAEAMACGKPVISTHTGGLPEIIEDGKTGILCPTNDTHAFVEAIRTLRHDPDLCRRIGDAGRKVILERFNLPRMVREYIAIYESILS